jgi:hypothetical protein
MIRSNSFEGVFPKPHAFQWGEGPPPKKKFPGLALDKCLELPPKSNPDGKEFRPAAFWIAR